MSDTPRTDAAEKHNATLSFLPGRVLADFARELERENNKLRQWIRELDEVHRCVYTERERIPAMGYIYPCQAIYIGKTRADILAA